MGVGHPSVNIHSHFLSLIYKDSLQLGLDTFRLSGRGETWQVF